MHFVRAAEESGLNCGCVFSNERVEFFLFFLWSELLYGRKVTYLPSSKKVLHLSLFLLVSLKWLSGGLSSPVQSS